MVAEHEYYRIVDQALVFQVFEEIPHPFVNILGGLQVGGVIGPDFRQVGKVGGQFQQPGIDTFRGIVPATVGVESPVASHMRGHAVEDREERLVLSAGRTVVARLPVALVPAGAMVQGRIVVGFVVVGAVITRIPQQLREQYAPGSVKRTGMHIHPVSRCKATGYK